MVAPTFTIGCAGENRGSGPMKASAPTRTPGKSTGLPRSRARKERAPGIPRGMMRGKCAHWLAMTRLF